VKMNKKLERKLDAEFKQMGLHPKVMHFMDVNYFNAITIVIPESLWDDTIRFKIEAVLYPESYLIELFHPKIRIINALKRIDIYGVAICDKRDKFNQQRNRIIAKRRLLKHLKEQNENDATKSNV
jgi:hypothetical protein